MARVAGCMMGGLGPMTGTDALAWGCVAYGRDMRKVMPEYSQRIVVGSYGTQSALSTTHKQRTHTHTSSAALVDFGAVT